MTSKIKDHHKIRANVAKDYAKAVIKKIKCCCNKPSPKGVAAKLAGYTDDELSALPEEAIVNSFGCGNPTAFAEINKGDYVLDLGSGAGIDLLLAARKVGPQGKVIGIDMTDAMIAKAKENIVAANVNNAEVRKGIIENLPVADASVDWVISNCVINLSPEKPKVFKEIYRVLKPGGRMIVSDIMAESLPQEITEHPRLYSSCLAGAISEKAYVIGLKAAGLIDVEIRERLIYEEEQLQNFLSSELNFAEHECCEKRALQNFSKILLNKVWSAKIYARKACSS
jgi:arsenite methyltransferase